MWYSCITTLAIWNYNEKVEEFAYICNPNASIRKILDLIRSVDEWAEIAFSAPQNYENGYCETLKKIVHKLNYFSNLFLQWEKSGICLYFFPNTSKSKFIDFITTVNKWAEIASSANQNAEKDHCNTLKQLVHKLNFHH